MNSEIILYGCGTIYWLFRNVTLQEKTQQTLWIHQTHIYEKCKQFLLFIIIIIYNDYIR